MREQITEQQAAEKITFYVMEQMETAWPELYDSLKNLYGQKFVVENEPMAISDLSLVLISLVIQSLRNKLPKEKSGRICGWIEILVDTPEYGKYSISEIQKYQGISEKNINESKHPLGGIVIRLLARWLGKEHFDNFLDDHTTPDGHASPVLIGSISHILTNLLAMTMFYWAKIESENEIVLGLHPKAFLKHKNNLH